MKLVYVSAFLSVFLLAPVHGNAAGSMLRVTCEGDDVGAEVLVNGKFRGECPIDLQVPAGPLKLLVRKKVDAQHERAFDQEIRMGEGSLKKVEAHLGATKLNAGEEARRAESSRRLDAMPFDALQKEATAGNADAMFKLANDYKRGLNGAPKSDNQAATWQRKAAEAGNSEAMDLFARYLFMGEGVAKDATQSEFWRTKAAESGNVKAMMYLAHIDGDASDSTPAEVKEALRWYRRAAEQGNTDALVQIGIFYYKGRSVPVSKEEAVAWWRKGAEAGDVVGMFLLGRSYAKGEGVAASEEQAINWWRIAAEGSDPLREAVEELKKRGLR